MDSGHFARVHYLEQKNNFNAHFILFYLIDPRKMQEKKFRNRFFNASLLKMNKFYFTYFFQKLFKINP